MSLRAATLAAIIGVAISVIIGQSFNFGLIPLTTRESGADFSAINRERMIWSLVMAVCHTGGLLVFLVALYLKQKPS